MSSNWNRNNVNHHLGLECYRGCDRRWYARKGKSFSSAAAISGPYKTLREAKLGAYGMLG